MRLKIISEGPAAPNFNASVCNQRMLRFLSQELRNFLKPLFTIFSHHLLAITTFVTADDVI